MFVDGLIENAEKTHVKKVQATMLCYTAIATFVQRAEYSSRIWQPLPWQANTFLKEDNADNV